jgi:hypothetical protein
LINELLTAVRTLTDEVQSLGEERTWLANAMYVHIMYTLYSLYPPPPSGAG